MKNIRNSLLILILILAFSSSFQTQNYFINGFSKEYDESDEFPFTQDNPTDSEWYTTWGRSGPDYLGDIAIDSSDNVYVVGVSTDPITSNQHINLTKFDSSGALLWTREWPLSKSDVFKAIAIDSEGNIYIAGSVTNDNGDIDFFIIKTDSSGNLLWLHSKWGPYTEQFFDIKVDSLDNIYIIGTQSWGAGLSDILIYKYHKDGYVIWKTLLDYSPTDIGLALEIDALDNIIVTGYVSGEDASWADIFLAKYDGTTGVNQWYKTIDYGGFDAAYSIAIDSSNNIFLAGLTQVGDNMDMLLVRCDSAGNPQWYRTTGKSGFDIYYSIGLDSSDDIYLMGIVDYPSYPYSVENADLYLEKYSNSGVKLWSRIWGENTNEIGYGMALDSAGNIYCCGLSGKFVDNSIDMLLVKFLPLNPIVIDDSDPTKDWAYTTSRYFWCSGSGTENDPYIIDGLHLSGRGVQFAIEVKNSYDIYFAITNCYFFDAGTSGIKFYYVERGSVINTESSHNLGSGIELERCNDVLITGNYFLLNSLQGVHLIESYDNIVSNNHASNNLWGIFLINSYLNTISNNRASNNIRGIGLSYSDLNTINGNDAEYNGYEGISIEMSGRNTIHTNTLNHNRHGIRLLSCDYNSVINNNIRYNIFRGIILDSCFRVTIGSDNLITHNLDGVFLDGGSDNLIHNNDISSNYQGIFSVRSDYNVIRDNNIQFNDDDGIYLGDSNDNTISNNQINYNSRCGIVISESTGNIIEDNDFYHNEVDGMRLYDSSDNTIRDNWMHSTGHWLWLVGIGILCTRSRNNNIYDNAFWYFVWGIWYKDCENVAERNTFYECGIAIFLNNSFGETIVNNTFINNTNGIVLNNATYTSIQNNTFIESIEYAIVVTNNSINNDIFYNNFTDNNDGDIQAYDDSGENSWTDEEGVGNYWSDYEERYPDAEVVDDTYTEPYELDGDVGVSDAGAQPPPIEDVVEKILFDVNESLGALKSLVENNLCGWKKFICERLVCSAMYLTASLIDTYSDEGVVSLVKVCVLKLKIYVIKRIASNSEIFLLCDEILAQIHELKNLI